MRKLIYRLLFTLSCLAVSTFSFAQETADSQELMRSNGKIYVVVACGLLILIGLFAYVFLIERKVSRLEKEGKNG